MVDQNEPTSDVPAAPRRPRRAASRPAGPPVAQPEPPTGAEVPESAGAGAGTSAAEESPITPGDEGSGALEAAERAQVETVPEEAGTRDVEGDVGAEGEDTRAEDVAAEGATDESENAEGEVAGTEGAGTGSAEDGSTVSGDDQGPVERAEEGTAEASQAEVAQAEAPQAEATEAEAPDAEEAVKTGSATRSTQRRPRRATRGVTTVAFSAEPAEEPAGAPAATTEVPALALFQPPDETKAVRHRRTRSAAQGTSEADGTGDGDGTAAPQPTATDEGDDTHQAGAQADDSGRSAGEQSRTAQRRKPRSTGKPAGEGADRDAEEAEPAGGAVDGAAVAPGPDDGSRDRGEDSAETDGEPADSEPADGEQQDGEPRRRRRRGGRRRRRSGGQGGPDQGEDSEEEAAATAREAAPEEAGREDSGDGEPAAEGSAEGGSDEESASSRRRRRRRRRAGVAEEMEDLSSDEPDGTVVKVREGRRAGSDEISSVRGSTRIEAKKQRRRDGRDAGRRRAPILTEAEFLARREAVNRVMCVREHGDRTQIAVLEDGILVEHYVNRVESSSMVGNVYLGKVQNVLPSMEAAFVDIGRGRNAVLYAGEVNWDAAGLEGQPKRIELALKSGDSVLVQVTKDPIGHKGARLTSQISLPGRFLVFVPQGSMTGISRKLPDTERARLKGILRDVVPEGAGVIVRTAAEGASEEQLTEDVKRLASQWADIEKKAKSASPPALLYGEPDLAIKVVRDIFNEDFTTLLVQGESTWRTLSEYISWVAPDLIGKLQQWVEPSDLYAAHRIDEQLAKALDRKVWLPSGGSLVIDRTEAMTVIDVNTGKFTGQGGNLEETVTRNNLEAAEEIVRQLRLRDIGGIIVVDFIDMVLQGNRDLVLRRLVECLGRDRTKHQVAEVTSLGLVQMTRKRIGQGLLEVFSTPCEACGGRGHLVSTEPVEEERSEERGRRGGGERGNRRGARKAPVNLGGKQTGKTPPPPKFDESGHPEHTGDAPAADHDAEAGTTDREPVGVDATEPSATDPGATEPSAADPGATEPGAAEPDATSDTAAQGGSQADAAPDAAAQQQDQPAAEHRETVPETAPEPAPGDPAAADDPGAGQAADRPEAV